MGEDLMKTLSVYISLPLVLSLFVYPSVSTAGENSGPRLVLEERTFEHEAVEQGEIVEHAFQVRNQGDETLEIKRVVPG
jgi:hypothetical protein